MRQAFDSEMASYDAWLTPAVVGEPPKLEKGNTLATFNRLFTALGLPCAGLPGFTGPYGLPVGIQLLAPRFADIHLLQVARIVEGLIVTRQKAGEA
jgi:Asp-tRNA(Asn)/Glu-tRNA(Gln) amidotransferase A subunit family amidase